MDYQAYPIFVQQRTEEPSVGLQNMYFGMGFILNDTDVLVYGQCDGYVFFTITDWIQACELASCSIFVSQGSDN
jgi:hypothetical protein